MCWTLSLSRLKCFEVRNAILDSIIHLSIDRIFGFTGAEAENVVYVNWLSMVQMGIESLKMYNPSIKKWLQPHRQASYVITRVLLEASKDLVTVKHIEESPNDGILQ